MKIDKNRLIKLTKLAKLDIPDSEQEKYIQLINHDLETLEVIDKIDVGDLQPLTNPYDISLRQYDDVVNDGDKVDELMNVAPEKLYNYFVVPKVIE